MTWSYLSSGLQYKSSVRYAVHRTATGAPPQHHHWGREDEAVVRARRGGFRLGGAAGNTGTVLGAGRGGRPSSGGCWGTGSGPWTGLRRSIETVSVLEPICRWKTCRNDQGPWRGRGRTEIEDGEKGPREQKLSLPRPKHQEP